VGAASGAGWTTGAFALCGFFRGPVFGAAIAATDSTINISNKTLRDMIRLILTNILSDAILALEG
jgi:hypothetical protein